MLGVAPLATQILSYAVCWCSVIPLLVGHYDFLQSSIDKFVSSVARLVFWREDKVSFVASSRNIICFVHFLFVGDFSFIRGCRKHECISLKINRACFYYPLRIRYHWVLIKVRGFLHMLTRFCRTCWPILIFRFHLKNVFVSRFSIYCWYLVFILEHSESLARLGVNFIYMWSRQERQNRDLSSFSRLSFFWKVPHIYTK